LLISKHGDELRTTYKIMANDREYVSKQDFKDGLKHVNAPMTSSE